MRTARLHGVVLTCFTAALGLVPAASAQTASRSQTESQSPAASDPFLEALARAKKKRPAPAV